MEHHGMTLLSSGMAPCSSKQNGKYTAANNKDEGPVETSRTDLRGLSCTQRRNLPASDFGGHPASSLTGFGCLLCVSCVRWTDQSMTPCLRRWKPPHIGTHLYIVLMHRQ